jgi:hypothetical protein
MSKRTNKPIVRRSIENKMPEIAGARSQIYSHSFQFESLI